ncbi:MAG: hypothetical protein HKL88_08460 [Bacteroidia bacterium]|nr:hypothetical protein [Bacteroidia bacterium]
MLFLTIAAMLVGAWNVINGILHDIFVLRSEFGKEFNRELLRLLMDGHILITCGVIQIACFTGIRENSHWAYMITGITCLSLLVYCAMIWKFLKSFATLILNAVLLITLAVVFFN